VTEHGPDAADATRRTRLANERTFLAWWRTGLTALAVGFGAGRLVPELAGGSNWPFEVIGVCFTVAGVSFIAYGYVRHRAVERQLAVGSYSGLPDRAALVFAGVGAVLGIATALLLIAQPS
jgi:putative membrane protein